MSNVTKDGPFYIPLDKKKYFTPFSSSSSFTTITISQFTKAFSHKHFLF